MSGLQTHLRGVAAIMAAALLLGSPGLAEAKRKKAGKARPAPTATSPIPSIPSVEAPRGAVDASQLQGARRSAPGSAPASASAAAPPAKAGGREAVQRESHIEFDERLVQGQTAAGAIYLFQRGESDFRSMVRLPASFRERTVREVLNPSAATTASRP